MIPIPAYRHRPRRKHPAIPAECALFRRPFEKLYQQHGEYCSRACAATAKRQAGKWNNRYPLDTAAIEE